MAVCLIRKGKWTQFKHDVMQVHQPIFERDEALKWFSTATIE